MIITAKYASICPCCNARIAVGSSVEWSRGEKAKHAACAKLAPSSGTRSSAPATRSFGRRSGAGYAASVAGYSSYCTANSNCGCYDCAS